MKRKFFQVSTLALCGALILGGANAAQEDTVHAGQPLKDNTCYLQCGDFGFECYLNCNHDTNCESDCSNQYNTCINKCNQNQESENKTE